MHATTSLEHPPWHHQCSAGVATAPPVSVSHNDPEVRARELFIGPFSVQNQAFVRRAAGALMQRCVMKDLPVPPDIVDALRLPEKARHAIGMAEALLQVSDLEQRRALLRQMIHAIVRLQ